MKNLVRIGFIAILIFVFTLAKWSKEGDPRFFSFLNSGPGKMVARVFHWKSTAMIQGDLEKDLSNLTKADQIYLEMAQEDLAKNPSEHTPLRYKDVLLKKSFPSYFLYKNDFISVFYSILQDPAPDIKLMINTVEKLSSDLRTTFSEVLDHSFPLSYDIIIFSDVASIQAFIAQQSLPTENSVAVYDSASNTIFTINPAGPEELASLRHEVAHAFYFQSKLNSENNVEGTWLIEGLATIAETTELLATDTAKLAFLKKLNQQNELIPLSDLLKHRAFNGFMNHPNKNEIDKAYLESWALVRFLMTPQYRQLFFTYLKYLRAPENLNKLFQSEPIQVLSEILNTDSKTLETAYKSYISNEENIQK